MAEGSKPIYRIKTEKNYRVRMRDGILIACDVYRPDAEGQFPAIFTMSPYGKDIQRLNVPAKPRALGEEWGVIEAGDTDYLVSRGYAHIIVDVRGIGYSEGTFDVCQRREQEDGYDLVEWAAEQPWCNGNCGMIGISYPAFIQYLVAAQQPPHLKAIFPHDGWGDMYRDVSHQGGIFMHGWLPDDWTTDLRMGFNASPASLGMYNEKELKRRIDKWLKHEVFNKHEKMVNSLLHPLYKPLIFDWVINEFDGPYYWERSAYTKWDKIKIPTYLSSEFHDYTVSMHLRGATEGWANIKAPKKLAFRQKAPEVPFHEFHDEIVRWYDHWLKGIDTGIMDEPPVKIWVRGAERWRYSTDFPLPETKYTNFYLAANNLLSEKGPSDNEKAFSSFKHKPVFPVTMGREPLDPMPDYLSYTTKPLNQDTEIIGYIALYLYASIATDDADFIVKVKDVSPDGSEFVLSRGWLKASHREVDKKKSKLWQPYHPHLQAEPVVPGEINEYAIEIRPIANLFKKGHQIKLEIWGCDYPADPMDLTLCWPSWSHLSYDKETSYKIYHTPKYSSHLVLPIIEGY
jgi:putative CocE/NonD family hydrolase